MGDNRVIVFGIIRKQFNGQSRAKINFAMQNFALFLMSFLPI